MVMRDDSGRIIDCNMRRFQGWCQQQEAEAIGIIEPLSWLRGRNTGTIILEMDAKAVFDVIQGEGADMSEFGQLIQEGRGKWKASQVRLSHVCREANVVADVIAKLGRTFDRLNDWGYVPQFICSIANQDVVCYAA